jgi:hypothetical protein
VNKKIPPLKTAVIEKIQSDILSFSGTPEYRRCIADIAPPAEGNRGMNILNHSIHFHFT